MSIRVIYLLNNTLLGSRKEAGRKQEGKQKRSRKVNSIGKTTWISVKEIDCYLPSSSSSSHFISSFSLLLSTLLFFALLCSCSYSLLFSSFTLLSYFSHSSLHFTSLRLLLFSSPLFIYSFLSLSSLYAPALSTA